MNLKTLPLLFRIMRQLEAHHIGRFANAPLAPAAVHLAEFLVLAHAPQITQIGLRRELQFLLGPTVLLLGRFELFVLRNNIFGC